MDDAIEQVFAFFIFDGDHYLLGRHFRQYLTIYQIEKIVEGETE